MTPEQKIVAITSLKLIVHESRQAQETLVSMKQKIESAMMRMRHIEERCTEVVAIVVSIQ